MNPAPSFSLTAAYELTNEMSMSSYFLRVSGQPADKTWTNMTIFVVVVLIIFGLISQKRAEMKGSASPLVLWKEAIDRYRRSELFIHSPACSPRRSTASLIADLRMRSVQCILRFIVDADELDSLEDDID
ncbi:hypothetical protein EW146_g4763 [Bondarzewia mesenterica]|uniref:Transmembrane protein n=1 Tax=Bondarzewia mesenterica TaxID=1095465 RepID=A0A4S4LTJ9_9AGAM|nr:hypothetical protein EW146_g4763 [Bondarzewia mesenterica]